MDYLVNSNVVTGSGILSAHGGDGSEASRNSARHGSMHGPDHPGSLKERHGKIMTLGSGCMQVAAAKRSLIVVVDTSLWAIMFAKAEPREECRHCHSLDHESGDCIQELTAESKGKEPPAKRCKTSDSEESKLVCFDYQTSHCRRGAQCRFRHLCEWCGASHPGYRCTAPGPTPRAGRPFPAKGRGGTTECKYLNPCTSQCDSCHRSKTQAKSIVLQQQPTLSSLNTYLGRA